MPTDIELDFDAVIIRAKSLLDVGTDSELAIVLQMKRSAFSSRKSKNSIPYHSLIKTLIKHDIDLNLVFNQNATAKNRYQTPRPCQRLRPTPIPPSDWFNPPQSMPAPRLSAHWQLS